MGYPSLAALPQSERPRERLYTVGAPSLSDAELLAVLLRTGVTGESALAVAQRLLAEAGDLSSLVRLSPQELSRLKGMGAAKAAELTAAVELGRRLAARSPSAGRPVIKDPGTAAALLMEPMRHLVREHFRLLLLNTKNHLIGIEEVSVGSLNASIVHPREIFATAIKHRANAIILAHNHPSGDPTPSPEDRSVTRRLVEAGRLLGIEVLDHVVIGDNRFISLREQGLEWT